MEWIKDTVTIPTQDKGLTPFTGQIRTLIHKWRISEGMCFLFIQHTSASLTISENYDPSARADIEQFMERAVPEGQPWLTHTLEGPDDSPSHIRSVLTSTSLAIPIDNGELNLGAWQGIFLFEHRRGANFRTVLVRCLKVN